MSEKKCQHFNHFNYALTPMDRYVPCIQIRSILNSYFFMVDIHGMIEKLIICWNFHASLDRQNNQKSWVSCTGFHRVSKIFLVLIFFNFTSLRGGVKKVVVLGGGAHHKVAYSFKIYRINYKSVFGLPWNKSFKTKVPRAGKSEIRISGGYPADIRRGDF